MNVEDLMSYDTDVTVPRFRDMVEVCTDDFEVIGLERGDMLIPVVMNDGVIYDDFLWECILPCGKKRVVFNHKFVEGDSRFRVHRGVRK